MSSQINANCNDIQLNRPFFFLQFLIWPKKNQIFSPVMARKAIKKSENSSKKEDFSAILLKWNKLKNKRSMPWKGEKDPYKIWLSEIILQQTRVEQGLAYYQRFIHAFPDVHQLAKASEEKLIKLWEGLGYYSRCRNLHYTAKYISNELKGKFPDSYEAIKALKGVGPYTAAAISSFAYNLPYAVVDGNVYRVLSRVFGIYDAIDAVAGKKKFAKLADELLDKKHPGVFNQAIMDFGATVCKPVSPLCQTCVFQNQCVACLSNRTGSLPVKEKKVDIKHRWFYYLVIQYKHECALQKRIKKDIWQSLYEFPLIEMEQEITDESAVLAQAEQLKYINKHCFELVSTSKKMKQQLSHQTIHAQFFEIKLTKKKSRNATMQWIQKKQIGNYSFPNIINRYLQSQKL